MPSPIFISVNANLLGFQCVLNASGLVAHPASPIPLARASGEIKRKGTAVVIVFNCPNSCDDLICAVAELKTAQYKINNCTDNERLRIFELKKGGKYFFICGYNVKVGEILYKQKNGCLIGL